MKTPVPDPARRHPVWLALADLYLDTELGAHSLRHIANVMAASGYTWAQIRQINYDEVAPALWFNVEDIAGEWAGWDEKWVIERITECYTGSERTTLGLASLWRKQVDFYTAKALAQIAALLP
jgi:hypothetical protein